MTVYLGYATLFEYPVDSDVFYSPGQDIPGITSNEMLAYEVFGHTFAGQTAPVAPSVLPPIATLYIPNSVSLRPTAVVNSDFIGPVGMPELSAPAQDMAPTKEWFPANR
jgi:hypothetical protein